MVSSQASRKKKVLEVKHCEVHVGKQEHSSMIESFLPAANDVAWVQFSDQAPLLVYFVLLMVFFTMVSSFLPFYNSLCLFD